MGGRRKGGRELEDEEERRQWGSGAGVGAMGDEGAVKLSTQFTQTALSARVEPLHCQTKEEGVESGGLTERW